MMSEDAEYLKFSFDFQNKYRSDIDQLSTLNDLIRKHRETVDLDVEKKLPFGQRDISRISFLVNKIRETEFPEKTIQYFAIEGIFVDKEERQIISSIYKDPMFKSSFVNYDKIFSVENF